MSAELKATGALPELPCVRWPVAMAASIGVGLWIMLGELDDLLNQVVTSSGRTWSPNQLSGPTAALHPSASKQGWMALASSHDPRVVPWLDSYVVADLAFIAMYVGVLCWCARSTKEAPRIQALIVLSGLADVVEDLLVLLLAHGHAGRGAALLPVVTGAKWVSLVVAGAVVLVSDRARLFQGVRLGLKGLSTHRYSALVVVPLAVLSLGRGPALLEQLPDIQRQWADSGGAFHGFLWASLVVALLTGAVAVISRQTTHYLALRGTTDPDTRPQPMLALWFGGPVVLVALGIILDVTGHHVAWWPRLAVFAGIPAGIGLASLVIGTHAKRPPDDAVPDDEFTAAAYVGDLLVGLVPLVAGLGAIRAFTAELALRGHPALSLTIYGVGWFTVLFTWLGQHLVVERLTRWSASAYEDRESPSPWNRFVALLTPGLSTAAPSPQGGFWKREWRAARTQWLGWATLLVALVVMALVAVSPMFQAHHFGVIATFQLALGSVSVFIAAVVILFAPGGAPQLFWILKLPRAPITTLVLVGLVAGGLAGSHADVHGIRTDAAKYPVPTRPTLDATFQQWLGATTACGDGVEITSSSAAAGTRELQVEALPLYAAQGGGIRAAYWTTAAIDQIERTAAAAEHPECGGAFLSSGASGGSVGLAVASTRNPGAATTAIDAMRQPTALAAAADGLVLRDTIYAASGLAAPSLDDPDPDSSSRAACQSVPPSDSWSDRGTLIERAWTESGPLSPLTECYVRQHPEWSSWGPTGALVLNSTSATTNCRTLISQVQLAAANNPHDDCAPSGGAPASTDLLRCTGQMRMVTAALLTARFPYVTPSGVVHCPASTGARASTQQIVDGGYAENNGLGTIDDLAPQLLSLVRTHNSCVVAAASCAEGSTTLVVPLVVFFENGSRADLLPAPPGLRLELLVPPKTLSAASTALTTPGSELERAEDDFAVDNLWDQSLPDAAAAEQAVSSWRGGNATFVVFRSTHPSVEAPLGWVLSAASACDMRQTLSGADQSSRSLGFGNLTGYARVVLGHEYVGPTSSDC